MQGWLTNLAEAVANVEARVGTGGQQKQRMAMIRQKMVVDPQNCLTCGEPEV